jgi:glycosyltransferase involved in cell wall biosynthesis
VQLVKIVIVSGMYPPIRTGTAFYSKNIAEALVKDGHAVRVVALQPEDLSDGELFPISRLRAFNLPLPGFFKHFRISSLYLSNYRNMTQILRESNADAVLLVNHYLDIAFPTIWATRRLKIPLLCSVGTQLQSQNRNRNRILNFLDRLVCGRMVFPFCDRVIAWDTQIRQYLEDVHGSIVTAKTSIVNYGVNGQVGDFLSHTHSYTKHNQILGVGAVSEQRSFVPLVRAFAIIADVYPSLRLKIIGHVYFTEAVRLAEELGLSHRVIFAGELPHDEVLHEMTRSDIFYSSLTAKYVGLGTATIEAMLIGLPTMVNTPLDLLGVCKLDDGRDIIHCPCTEPRDIADRLRTTLNDASLRARVGQGGRTFIQNNMNWQKIAQDMSAAISTTISRHHATPRT